MYEAMEELTVAGCLQAMAPWEMQASVDKALEGTGIKAAIDTNTGKLTPVVE